MSWGFKKQVDKFVRYFSVNDKDNQRPNYDNDGAVEDGDIAIGVGSVADGALNDDIGAGTDTGGAIALGRFTKAFKTHALAIGNYAEAREVNGIAIGELSKAIGVYAAAIGTGAEAQANSLSIGDNAGKNNVGESNTFIGRGTGFNSQGSNNLFQGKDAGSGSNGDSNTLIGNASGASLQGSNNIIVGLNAAATAQGSNNIAFGETAFVGSNGDWNTAFGKSALVQSDGIGNIGSGIFAGALANGNRNSYFGLGAGALNTGSGNVAVGDEAGTKSRLDDAGNPTATVPNNVNNSVAVGRRSFVTDDEGIALGALSEQTISRGVSGFDPATSLNSTDTSLPWTSTQAPLSIGNVNNTRQLNNLAAGTEDTDAVNVAQLKKLLSSISESSGNEVQGFSRVGTIVDVWETVTLNTVDSEFLSFASREKYKKFTIDLSTFITDKINTPVLDISFEPGYIEGAALESATYTKITDTQYEVTVGYSRPNNDDVDFNLKIRVRGDAK